MPPDIRSKEILKFWHCIEFFIPFDLQGSVLEHKDAEWSVKMIDGAALKITVGDGEFWGTQHSDGKTLSGFDLYLGIFDKSELALTTQALLCGPSSAYDGQDQIERGDLEGATCIARIQLNRVGELLEKKFSVSTVPWALGRLRSMGLAGLNFDDFLASQEDLKEKIKCFVSERHCRKVRDEVRDDEPQPINADDLMSLQDIFCSWAEFNPNVFDQRMVVIRAKFSPMVPEKEISKKQKDSIGEPDEDSVDDVSSEDEDITIDILNSFFAKDIERVLASTKHSEPLKQYLSFKNEQPAIDLYTKDAMPHLWSALKVMATPASRWLSNPFHSMSMMQQFAINSAFDCLSESGIFSVNGPPGTGKTTLLRDIFAENITRRARILANLHGTESAFSGERFHVDLSNGKVATLNALIPELTGYEMLVVSYNNNAVENISKDLPKSEALGTVSYDDSQESDWRYLDGRPKVTYLRQVANKVASRKSDGSFKRLELDEAPWGLISCALGNYGKRKSFAKGAFGTINPKGEKPKGYDPEVHQSVWDWRKGYRGVGFKEAQNRFLACQQRVDQRRLELEQYVEILIQLHKHSLETYISKEMNAYTDVQERYSKSQKQLEELKQGLQSRVADIDALNKLLTAMGRPRWFDRLFRRAIYRDAIVRRTRVTDEYEVAIFEKISLAKNLSLEEKNASLLQAEFKEVAHRLREKRAKWDHLDAEAKRLSYIFPRVVLPEDTDDLKDDHWQISGLWNDPTLNRLRSSIFALALELHEAWLSEAKGFGQNLFAISNYLEGARLSKPELAIHIWQSLFIMVPVISSTFASVANQFRDLGPSSLGWLFIDEAGQAVPQAAVGALWRSKRAVIVGDPLQIEPVFTVPIKLINAISESCQMQGEPFVLPNKASVQTRADAVNLFGTTVRQADGTLQWIGTPLRVHRRCNNPMFDVANEIAYQNKMVLGSNPDNELKSFWVHIKGAAIDKQVVNEQVELVTEAIIAIFQATGQLPALYVISPFKRIKEVIKTSLSNGARWQKTLGICKPPPKKALTDWCRERIGTVHTFQGKEESMVWLILGCDQSTQGAIEWACAKPNILNVALTRAKHRFFFIGDQDIWGGRSFFEEATHARFPRISVGEFLYQVTGRCPKG